MSDGMKCELCEPAPVVCENALAIARLDNRALARGHILVIPRRHVADFFEMTPEERVAVFELVARAERQIRQEHKPDGYNIGVNVGTAAGQSRMHVHVHLIPRYAGDVPDPRGGIRRALE